MVLSGRGVIILVTYEAFFLFLLLLCIHDLVENHEAWQNYRKYSEDKDYDGYLDYEYTTFWTCLCSMMVGWPVFIALVGCCCGEDKEDEKKILHAVLLDPSPSTPSAPSAPAVENAQPVYEGVVVTTVTV